MSQKHQCQYKLVIIFRLRNILKWFSPKFKRRNVTEKEQEQYMNFNRMKLLIKKYF